ncbi:hypothetical protein NQ314_017487 [Rhamnusium bicolor]|uniref:DUF5641 domain-containing protein n=1 Tax=Rhamnusium bicolor TaxID=1586634 RepID=A0AAV8WU28_9CUCU|nr:hypothetical protein NQ314_017487 [Rhamnusium bicolor]
MNKTENLKTGDLVILKEDNINPSRCPLARILEINPSANGIVRVISIKRAEGHTLKRSIHKVIPLAVAAETDIPNVATVDEHVATNVITTNSNTSHKSKGTPLNIRTLFLLFGLLLSTLPKSTQGGYTIQYPPPELYVKHIGHTRIERDIVRVELKYA